MSLFKQLETLYRSDRKQGENILTEIVAQVLRNSKELTLEWLRSLEVTEIKNPHRIQIATQHTFKKLDGHEMDSRPDILIRLFESENEELVFIESKVGAKEGDKQLLRYAEHLADQKAKRQEIKRISLIFITRDFEAVEKPTSSDSAFKFKPTRWFEFYIKLKAHWEKNSDGLAKQLKLFMEENRMSLGNKFRSIDLVAMENFFSAESLMEETLTGEVLLKAQKILGTVTNLKKVHEEMRERNRFTLDSDLNKIFGCLIGYWFPKENPDEPVWVGVDVYAYPGKPEEAALIKAFRDWIKKSNGSWVGMRLDGEWACIRKGKTMQSLIAGDDHVRAVKDHLLQLIEEVEQFKNEYPNLPWLLVPEIGTAAVQPATIQP